MRILLANEARAGAGGVETYLAAAAEGLRRRGHDVALLFANSALDAGPTVIAAAPSWSVADGGLAAAVEQAAHWRPDVCFAHNMRDLDIDRALLERGPVMKMMRSAFGTCVSGPEGISRARAVAVPPPVRTACLVHYVRAAADAAVRSRSSPTTDGPRGSVVVRPISRRRRGERTCGTSASRTACARRPFAIPLFTAPVSAARQAATARDRRAVPRTHDRSQGAVVAARGGRTPPGRSAGLSRS